MNTHAGHVINMAWQLGGDASLLRAVASESDFLVLVECRDKDNNPIDVKTILGADWLVWQNTANGSVSGTAIAVRKGCGIKPRRALSRTKVARLMRISRKGRKVQARYLRAVRLRDEKGPLTLAGAHPPLRSTGLQAGALKAISRWWKAPRKGRVVLFMDGNNKPAVIARVLGVDKEHFFGADVMVELWAGGWGQVHTVKFRHNGSDHFILRFVYTV